MSPANRISLVLRPVEGQTLEKISRFIQLGAYVVVGRGLAVIAAASDRDLVTPALDREEFDADEHIRMALDAKRYRWLRNRDRVQDADTDLVVTRGDYDCFFSSALDREIDDAMRLESLEACQP